MDMQLILAIILGMFFGFALNRVGATNPENIINMVRLTDLRLMKAILFAVGLSSVSLFLGLMFGVIDAGHLSIKSAYIGVVVGGALLGIGFTIAGYCPGTGLAAAGTGRKDALVFVLGGFVGAFLYMLAYEWLTTTFPALFTKLAGGSVSLATTGNEKCTALFPQIGGEVLGVILGIIFIIIAFALPTSCCHKKNT